jgi:hypothetical protein
MLVAALVGTCSSRSCLDPTKLRSRKAVHDVHYKRAGRCSSQVALAPTVITGEQLVEILLDLASKWFLGNATHHL